MKFLRDALNRIFNHWQTTLIAAIIGAITIMFYNKTITTQEWILAIGGVSTLWALFQKDPDKTQTKPPKEWINSTDFRQAKSGGTVPVDDWWDTPESRVIV